MTRKQLLTHADSRELTLWQYYLEADAEERAYQQKVARDKARAKELAGGGDVLSGG